MPPLYDSQDIISTIRPAPVHNRVRGVISAAPYQWGAAGSTSVTYSVDITTPSGETLTLPRVQESVPWFYQSGFAHREVGDVVSVARVGRGNWRITDDDDTQTQWDPSGDTVYLDNRRHYADPPAVGAQPEAWLELVKPPAGRLVAAAYDTDETPPARLWSSQVFLSEVGADLQHTDARGDDLRTGNILLSDDRCDIFLLTSPARLRARLYMDSDRIDISHYDGDGNLRAFVSLTDDQAVLRGGTTASGHTVTLTPSAMTITRA